MTDIVIAAAARTPVGSFNGALGALPAHELGHVAIKAALERAGGRSRPRCREVILGQVLTAGAGPEPGAPGGDRGRHPGREAPRSASTRSAARACAPSPSAARRSQTGDASIVVAGGQESMSQAPHAAHLRDGTKMGDARAGRHHDQGRPVGRLQRLPHGHHRRERGAASTRSPATSRTPSPPRSQNKAEAAQKAGRFKDEIVPVTVKTRKGDMVVDTRRVHPATAPRSRRWPSCARPSPRTARSPPATPRASTTAPPRWC